MFFMTVNCGYVVPTEIDEEIYAYVGSLWLVAPLAQNARCST
jgi:hypothetical protein